jgi:ferric-dicitrate binding protein FerR (iron transport regulator)
VENTFNHIDDLIGKYLAQEASAEETNFLHAWLSQSEANRRHFDQFKMIFDSAATVKNLPAFDTDEAWNNLKARLHQKPAGKTVTFQPQASTGAFWRIAASIVFVLGAGFFAYQLMKPASVSTMEVATKTTSESDTLPDGSGVFLNKETKLAYTYDRKKKAHVVKLKGEAYFNIQHDDDKTFVIEVDDVLIKDIGTSFNVKAYPEANTIEVVVEAGEVMFYTAKDSGIYLRAGGKGVYHKSTKTFTVEQIEPNVTAYKTRFFIFSDSDLGTVMEELNAVYDKRIRVANNLKSCRLTVSFNNENIDEIANVIAETLGLTMTTTDHEIVLEGKGCE